MTEKRKATIAFVGAMLTVAVIALAVAKILEMP